MDCNKWHENFLKEQLTIEYDYELFIQQFNYLKSRHNDTILILCIA